LTHYVNYLLSYIDVNNYHQVELDSCKQILFTVDDYFTIFHYISSRLSCTSDDKYLNSELLCVHAGQWIIEINCLI